MRAHRLFIRKTKFTCLYTFALINCASFYQHSIIQPQRLLCLNFRTTTLDGKWQKPAIALWWPLVSKYTAIREPPWQHLLSTDRCQSISVRYPNLKMSDVISKCFLRFYQEIQNYQIFVQVLYLKFN
jgi:hypothetical protein